MVNVNVEGAVGPNLTDAKKRCCTRCNGSQFYIEETTGNPGAGEKLYFLCAQCGYEFSVTIADLGATQNYG